jgi:hypothetical protein
MRIRKESNTRKSNRMTEITTNFTITILEFNGLNFPIEIHILGELIEK